MTRVSAFLKERKDRFDPDRANASGLKRVRKIDFSGTVHLNDEVLTRTKMILVKPGDLLISGINAEKGAVSVYAGKEDALATIHYSSYEYDPKKINVEYLKYLLMSPVFKRVLQEHNKSGIKTELKPKKILSLELPLPDIKNQKSCVNYLHRLINKIDLLNNQVLSNGEAVKKIRQAILQEAVRGKLVKQNPNDESAIELLKKIKTEKEQLIKRKKIKKENPLPPIVNDEIPYELPKGWALAPVSAVSSKVTDGTHKTPNYTKTGVIFISAKDIMNGTLNLNSEKYISRLEHEQLYKRCNPKKGDLLVTKSGSIGRVAVVEAEDKFSLFESVALIKVLDGISPYYLGYVIYLNAHNEGNVKGLAVKHLHLNMLRNIIVPLPSLSEQKRIVEKVNKLMKYCDELEAKINQSKADSEKLMQAVLQEAFEN